MCKTSSSHQSQRVCLPSALRRWIPQPDHVRSHSEHLKTPYQTSWWPYVEFPLQILTLKGQYTVYLQFVIFEECHLKITSSIPLSLSLSLWLLSHSITVAAVIKISPIHYLKISLFWVKDHKHSKKKTRLRISLRGALLQKYTAKNSNH